MKTIQSKTIYWVLISSILFLLGKGYSDSSIAQQSEVFNRSGDLEGLQLDIALVLSSKGGTPKLAFIAKNNSKQEITIPEFCRLHNEIEIVWPNGTNQGNEVTFSGTVSEITIKPSESKIWYKNTYNYNTGFRGDGVYRLKWKVYNVESKEFLLYRNNEKEKEPDIMSVRPPERIDPNRISGK